MPYFNTILREAGVEIDGLRLVRHQDKHSSGRTPFSLWQRNDGSFDLYQRIQVKTPFYDATSLASFVVNHNQETVFVGLYAVIGSKLNTETAVCPLYGEDRLRGTVTVYEIERRNELSELSGRLVIGWGKGTRSWIQIANNQNKAVVAIDRSISEPQFPGFSAFVRSTDELLSTPKSWQSVLSAVQGVYLLVCKRTGEQYVGSAYGDGGFWGRWQGYANGGHGGNILLKRRDNAAYDVSVLDTASMSATREMIIDLEQKWKAKLGSRAHGLNAN